ncbi:hypothetical protein MKK84_32795 [Methylobacterium sp. E-065]|uniref:hypothetical protein n=1 Tax=Methylobacterium sp. E-065 TaxID=2836583 RepID=UPI001FB9A4CE|nr:hypothetical protein [Methylobacterium sp. E-065]MCJ2022127.1 hypothetical protein [Methylobacterium sp. E-065]
MNTADYADAFSVAAFFGLIGYGILIADAKHAAEIEQGLWILLCACTAMVTVVGTALMLDQAAQNGGYAAQSIQANSRGIATWGSSD